MLQAAKDSEPDSRTVFKQERKREAEESLDEGPTKRLKAENPTVSDNGQVAYWPVTLPKHCVRSSSVLTSVSE